MERKRIAAVIPAAGRGTRLAVDVPKILVPIDGRRTVWTILRDKLLPHVEHIHVVLSPDGDSSFQEALSEDPNRDRISTSIQDQPLGMGDAIFRGYATWSAFDTILIVWGDQVFLSERTIERSLEAHASGSAPSCALPLVAVEDPYVQYVFDSDGTLRQILQSREGDVCTPGGDSDVGAFVLSVEGLETAWQKFVAESRLGAETGEINFLPFLGALSQEWQWPFRTVRVDDPTECRGINTPEDLDFFRKLYGEGAEEKP